MKSRRQFLKNAGAGIAAYLASPHLTQFLNHSLMVSAIQQAGAETLGVSPRKLINIGLFGAPMRFTFDQFLKTHADETVAHNAQVATRFSRGGSEAGTPIYEVESFQRADGSSILVPPLWKTSVNGQKLESLLPHMAVFRGYGTDVDGHPFNYSKQLWPLNSLVSLGGLVADAATGMFPAVQYPYNPSLGFKSGGKVSLQPVNQGGNLLKQLYAPFEQHQVALSGMNIRSNYSARLEDIQARMRTIFDNLPQTKQFSKDHTARAIASIKQGIAGFDDVWNQTLARYRQVVNGAAREMNVYGFTDQPIIKRTDNDIRFRVTFAPLGDPQLEVGYNLQNEASTWDFTQLAESFALADYLLREQASNYVDIMAGFQPALTMRLNGQTESRTHVFDEHQSGIFVSTFLNGLFFRGMSGGLVEIMNRLKEKNLFDETVIKISCEFGRSPRADASGSDHGFNSMVTSVYSGAIKKGPFVLGNIAREHAGNIYPLATYPGTWGYWAPTPVGGQSELLSPTHVNSSLAVLTRAPHNPWNNLGAPLLKAVGNEIVYADGVSDGRIV